MQGGNSQYAIELIPANGFTQCIVNNGTSVIDTASTTFSLRTTGRSGDVKRSLGATLRRKSFLDYLYFTDYGTSDPKVYAIPAESAYAQANCVKYRPGPPPRDPTRCREIQFADADEIQGPFHTNDDILTCNQPTFGRNVNDRIEVSGPAPGWRAVCGAGGRTRVQGHLRVGRGDPDHAVDERGAGHPRRSGLQLHHGQRRDRPEVPWPGRNRWPPSRSRRPGACCAPTSRSPPADRVIGRSLAG